jgi:hypothetical protein
MKKFLIAVFAVALVAVWVVPSMAVELGGQVMIRGEYDKNRDFEDDFEAGRGADAQQRTQIHATANPTDSTTVHVSIQSSGAWGDVSNDHLEFHEAYVQEDNLFGSDLSLRIGRQVLSYDDQRIIGALNWSRTPNKDDAIKLSYGSDEFDVEAFAAKKTEVFRAAGNDDDLYGVHATVKTIPNNSLSVYTFIQHSGSMTRYTLGARLKGSHDSGIDYTAELPFQTGQLSDTVDISAYAFAIRGGYTVPGPNKVRIGGEYAFATGDDTGDATENQGFNVIQPTGHAHLGSMDENGWGNIKAYSVNASAMATPELKVIAAYWKFDLEEVAGGAPDDNGSEVDLTGIYKYNSALTIKGGYSFYLPGDIQEAVTPTSDNTAHWAWLMAVANF